MAARGASSEANSQLFHTQASYHDPGYATMPLIVSSRTDRGVAIFQPQGKLALGPALHNFQVRVDRALSDKSCAGLVLNLDRVSDMDSAGIGELVKIHSTAARRRLRVALVQVSPRLMEMLAITRVDAFFILADSEPAALAAVLGAENIA
jgi:stage II sporulation protein AA (anti-sigma F factor antagonist)